MSSDITQETEWDSLVLGKKLVAADFWAPWRPYCMRLKPIFESIASKYPNIRFVKINVDEQEGLASKYGFRGIPVIKFFCDGREVGEQGNSKICRKSTFDYLIPFKEVNKGENRFGRSK